MIVARYLALVLLLTVFAAPAMAASFDCGRATTPFEHAICDTPELSRADEVLAKAFGTATGGLTRESVTLMREDQRNWLNFARRACTDDAEPLTIGRYDEDGAMCLLDKFNARVDALEQSRMVGGHRFLVTSAYRALPDPDEVSNPDSYWKVAAHELVLPLLDADDPLAEAFNAFVLEQADGSSEMTALLGGGDDSALDGRTDTIANVAVKEVAGTNRITLTQEIYYYPHGAAHGGTSTTFLHYLVDEQRALETSDIFAGDDWGQTLVDLAWTQLQTEHSAWLQVETADDIAAIVVDPARWDFSGDYGLVIQFNQYEVAAYAYGAPTITVSWESLSGIAAENQSAMLYGQ